jgi:hypothetical protein
MAVVPITRFGLLVEITPLGISVAELIYQARTAELNSFNENKLGWTWAIISGSVFYC